MLPKQLRRLVIRVCVVAFLLWGATLFLGLWKDDKSTSDNGNIHEMAIDAADLGIKVEDNLNNIGRVGDDNFVAEPVTESQKERDGLVTRRLNRLEIHTDRVEHAKKLDELYNHDTMKETTEDTEEDEDDVQQIGAPVKRRDNDNVAMDAPGNSLCFVMLCYVMLCYVLLCYGINLCNKDEFDSKTFVLIKTYQKRC